MESVRNVSPTEPLSARPDAAAVAPGRDPEGMADAFVEELQLRASVAAQSLQLAGAAVKTAGLEAAQTTANFSASIKYWLGLGPLLLLNWMLVLAVAFYIIYALTGGIGYALFTALILNSLLIVVFKLRLNSLKSQSGFTATKELLSALFSKSER